MAHDHPTLPNPESSRASRREEKEELDIHVAFDGRLYVKPNDLLRSKKFREQVEAFRNFRLPEPRRHGG